MGFGDWLTHCLTSKENAIVSGMWNIDSPWDKVVIQFLVISPNAYLGKYPRNLSLQLK